MGRAIRLMSVAERRARLAVRHHLAPPSRAATAQQVARDLVALHGTDPASVYLAVWARTTAVSSAAIEHELYAERVLVRMLGMRRTMFVVPTETAPVIQAACTDEVARRMRRRVAQLIGQAGISPDPERWLKEVGEATVAALTERGVATGAELTAAEPRLAERITFAEGKSYGGPANISSRILMLLSAEGHIVRGRPRGGWTSSQFQWYPAAAWLPPPAGRAAGAETATGSGESALAGLAPGPARVDLARRWLRTFGPAPATDLQWWAGWTAGQVKAALAELPTAEVDLDGTPALMLDGDEDPGPAPGPWAALLPALDPTAMGWRDRTWYVGEHTGALFDRSGNIGPTVWWDGRVIGGWAQRRDGEIVFRLLEDAGADAAEAVSTEADRLERWLGPVRVTPRFRTPLERELTA